jgi:ribonuclease Z
MMLSRSTSVSLNAAAVCTWSENLNVNGPNNDSKEDKPNENVQNTKKKIKKRSNNYSVWPTLIGRSRAGDGTGFAIPELKWMFDVGARVQTWKPGIIFLTHTHADHVHYLTHVGDESNPPTVYLPEEAAPFVQAYLVAYRQMTDCKVTMMTMTTEEEENEGRGSCVLRPTKPGEDIVIQQGGSDYVVRTVAMDHRVPCLGYSIFKKIRRLKEEYIGMPGAEIGRLRRQGVEVTVVSHEEPLLCFMGDTTAVALERHPELLRQHRFIECSFIDDASRDNAVTTKHMHWEDLRPHVEAHPDTMFLLTHFSLKYSCLTLRNFFCEQQEKYDNIHPMMVEEEVTESWKSEGEPPRCKCRLCRNTSM